MDQLGELLEGILKLISVAVVGFIFYLLRPGLLLGIPCGEIGGFIGWSKMMALVDAGTWHNTPGPGVAAFIYPVGYAVIGFFGGAVVGSMIIYLGRFSKKRALEAEKKTKERKPGAEREPSHRSSRRRKK